MNRRSVLAARALCAAAASCAGSALAQAPALSECHAIPGAAERLACYDRVSGRAPAPPSAQSCP